VINDQTLLDIASRLPRNLAELSRIQGMNDGQLHRHGARILEAVERGQNSVPIYPPRNQKPAEAYLERLEALRKWRKRVGEQMGVNSDIILPRELMLALAERDPRTAEELAEVLAAAPWRRERYGEQILEVIRRSDEG